MTIELCRLEQDPVELVLVVSVVFYFFIGRRY